jgi:dihydroflavonol-4-reductase
MSKPVLVTGANGHLGTNLAYVLRASGAQVIAGVRGSRNPAFLQALGCKVAHVEMLDKRSLMDAMVGVDTVYQVAAVFRHWARDPQREIYQANLEGTRNVLEAAAGSGVRRVVYVSSLATLDRSENPITERGWNFRPRNVYFRSKMDAEKLAWDLADGLGLSLISVLPGAMIGRNCLRMTATMDLLRTIVEGRLPVNPGFFFNFVDVMDVATACRVAALRGRPGERYLLANENCTSIEELVHIAQQQLPQLQIKTPPKPPKAILGVMALLMETWGRIRGVEPRMQQNFLTEFRVRERCDISKARRELGFNPRAPHEVIADTFRYLAELSVGEQTPRRRIWRKTAQR